MKIGEFAKKNNISIDTVRHYMDLGVIVAQKKGGQYDFSDSCQQSLNEVFNLKDMGFSLSEIKTIFIFRLLGKFTDYQQQEYFRSLFLGRQRSIARQINELKSMHGRLSEEIENLASSEVKKNFTMGVNVSAISRLKCRKCGGDLSLASGTVENSQIINGVLRCGCKTEYPIEDGILFSSPLSNTGNEFSEDYIADYIKSTDADYLDKIYKSIEYFNGIFDMSLLENKLVLELGSGMGFLLRNIYSALPESCVYVAVDYDINRHMFLKRMLERTKSPKNIILVCGEFTDTPLKDGSADAVFDFSGTSNYSFENTDFLLDTIDHFMRREAHLMGSYIVFKNFSPQSEIEEKYRKNFVLKNIKKGISDMGYKMIKENTSPYMTSGGPYENYFVEGEKVYGYQFFGKRPG